MLTIRDAAAKWDVSTTVVRKWITQGRVPVERYGGRTVLIPDDARRPERAAPGELSPEAREGWNYGAGYKPEKPARKGSKGRRKARMGQARKPGRKAPGHAVAKSRKKAGK